MPRIFITSGTSYRLPADFNPSSNTVECYGGGGSGGDVGWPAGGGGAYAKVNNINVIPGAIVTIQIGSGGLSSPSTDTYFNATSLANAVSNGVSISCGAQGATGRTGGAAASSCGTTKYNGGTGGVNSTYGGGGGGACAGPSGAGGSGATPSGPGGGGGGGANGGSNGTNSGSSSGGYGGNGPGGSGGGVPNGGSGTPGTGGGGAGGNGGPGPGGHGALNDIYSTGVYGPGGGGGGGGGTSNLHGTTTGGAAGGYGAGGGAAGFSPFGEATASLQTDGLIVITYVSAPIGGPRGVSGGAGILPLRAPYIVATRGIKRIEGDTFPQKMDWLRQPLDLLQRPPGKIIYKYSGSIPRSWPNLTPLYKPPWLQHPELIRHPVTLDYRQQFPGKAPVDFFANLREDKDTISAAIDVKSYINATLLQYDEVVATINPSPILGGSEDIIRRVKLLLPKGWFNDVAPIRDAIIGGIADASAWGYSLVTYAKKQTRVAWATGVWLDILSKDYFRFELPRKVNEQDEDFRARVQKELVRERVTRKGMIDALTDLTGKTPYIFEPWNTGDTGAWDVGTFAFDVGGGWGDTILPAQAFVNVVPPGAGIPNAPGWDTPSFGWDVSGMWGDMNLIAGTITDQDVYDTINRTRPTGSIVWTQLFPPAGPTPVPTPRTRTPSFAPPAMIQPVVRPGMHRYSIGAMPPGGGPKARVLT